MSFSDALKKRVYQFSVDHYNSSKDLYNKRNFKNNNLIDKIYYSKLAEFKVYHHLISSNRRCLSPDLNILSGYKKSYDSDIYCYSHDVHIHVKSCSIESANKYGLAWIVQKNDPIMQKKYLNHWYAFVTYSNSTDMRLIGFLNSKNAIYKETTLKHKSKLAIFYDNIKHLM